MILSTCKTSFSFLQYLVECVSWGEPHTRQPLPAIKLGCNVNMLGLKYKLGFMNVWFAIHDFKKYKNLLQFPENGYILLRFWSIFRWKILFLIISSYSQSFIPHSMVTCELVNIEFIFRLYLLSYWYRFNKLCYMACGYRVALCGDEVSNCQTNNGIIYLYMLCKWLKTSLPTSVNFSCVYAQRNGFQITSLTPLNL
jgi:hypothetical protein